MIDLVISSTNARSSVATHYYWWGVSRGQTVAFLHTLLYSSSRIARHMVCSVEVREDFRGNGLALELIKRTEDALGETAYTSGHFTPKGAAALLGRIPVEPGEGEPGVYFNDMTFVLDWSNREHK